ncbi:hypothetical protein DFH09DRAFT_1068895 [Mycena vulgaris]|nr:hypothetical protein DFH09DRAFT_1068895 [Mycena vulgaris]
MTDMNGPTGSAATGAEDTSSAPPAPSQGLAMPQALSSPHGYYAFVPYPHGTMEAAAAAVQQAIVAPPLVVAPPPAPAPAPAPAPLQAVVNIPNPHIVTGIPAGLASLLRWTGPWSANVIYSVAPTGPLAPVDEPVPAPEWYCITRGRFVGVIDQYAQAHYAIRGVSNAANKAYSTQAIALNAFNQVVAWGGIENPYPVTSMIMIIYLETQQSLFPWCTTPRSHAHTLPTARRLRASSPPLLSPELGPCCSHRSGCAHGSRLGLLYLPPSIRITIPEHLSYCCRAHAASHSHKPFSAQSQILSNGSPMPPLSLFDIAALLSPDNPTPPPREQLERLTAHLSLADLQTVVQLLGLGDLARITTPLMPRVMAAAQSILDETPPAQDDELDHLIRDFDLASLQPRPHGPQTSRPASQPRAQPHSTATPARTIAPVYHFSSPGKTGSTADW